jgi:hypothetical protein
MPFAFPSESALAFAGIPTVLGGGGIAAENRDAMMTTQRSGPAISS